MSDRSRLAVELQRIFDHPVFTREEWATILSVREAEITQWLSDEVFPRPETLRRIGDVLLDSIYDVSDAVVARWEAFTYESLKVGSDSTTLAHYMCGTLRDAFLRQSANLDPTVQEEVLLEAAGLIRQRRGQTVTKVSVAE